MPRSDEPRIVVRLSAGDSAVIEAAAAAAGVAVGALVRECAVRYAAEVARDVSAGRVRLRRRSAAVPVPSPTAPSGSGSSSEAEKSEPVPVLDAVAPSGGVGKVTRPVVPASGPDRAAAFRAMAARRSDTGSTGGER